MSNQPLILGIDATNISSGGGLMHLSRLLGLWNPHDHQFQKIIVWSGSATLDKLPNYPWIVKNSHPWLDKNIVWRFMWRLIYLPSTIFHFKCSVIFSPGGLFVFRVNIPQICMCQNLLPFDADEILRFGFSLFTLKLILLRIVQKISLSFSRGVIFLSSFSRDQIEATSGIIVENYSIIPHGVDKKFFLAPRKQLDIAAYHESRPFQLLYVSPIWPYKNYENVVLAVSRLRDAGYQIRLDIVGSHPHLASYKNLMASLESVDKNREYIHYHGAKTFDEILSFYHEADLFVFASSCESFGQIITEAMASGLPIACSKLSSMAETLGDSAIYFDPFSSESLYQELKTLMDFSCLRTQIASKAYLKAKRYSWDRCANETFEFIYSRSTDLQLVDSIDYPHQGGTISKGTFNSVLLFKSEKNKALLKTFLNILFIGISTSILYSYFDQLKNIYSRIDSVYIALAILGSMVATVIGALKLSVTFDFALDKKIHFSKWLKIYLESFFINNTIPYFGLVYRALFLKKSYQISYLDYASASYIVAILGLAMLFFFAAIILFISSHEIIYISLAVVLLTLLFIKVILVKNLDKLRFQILGAKINFERFTIFSHLQSIYRGNKLHRFIQIFSIGVFVDFIVYFFTIISFQITLPVSSLVFIYFSYSLSWIVRITPANIGTQELMVGAMSSLVGFGVLGGIALSLALRVVYLLGSILLYGLVTLFTRYGSLR